MKNETKNLARNKKAKYSYFIKDEYEAGIELKGAEVKSVRAGKININDSYIRIKNSEAFIINMHISENKYSAVDKLDPKRSRKLLLKKQEINKLAGKSSQKGYAIVPLSVYTKGKYIKVKIALGQGKREFDKKRTIKERDIKKEMDRELKNYR